MERYRNRTTTGGEGAGDPFVRQSFLRFLGNRDPCGRRAGVCFAVSEPLGAGEGDDLGRWMQVAEPTAGASQTDGEGGGGVKESVGEGTYLLATTHPINGKGGGSITTDESTGQLIRVEGLSSYDILVHIHTI